LIRNSMFDRPIFLIDEATSAIDEAARVQVIKEFLNTSATVLWIEHNLSKKITNLFDRQIYLRK
ncbi:ATP-binding cassette domain-containing protein, partial [Lactobacillus crispatus]